MKKTIKIIDLLNLIANGEEVPKKIKYRNKIYIKRSDCYWYILENGTFDDELFVRIDCLTNEVEIINDEEKFEDIEEIKMIGCNVKIKILNKESNFGTDTPIVTEHCISKINQLIKNQKKIIEKLSKNNITQ